MGGPPWKNADEAPVSPKTPPLKNGKALPPWPALKKAPTWPSPLMSRMMPIRTAFCSIAYAVPFDALTATKYDPAEAGISGTVPDQANTMRCGYRLSLDCRTGGRGDGVGRYWPGCVDPGHRPAVAGPGNRLSDAQHGRMNARWRHHPARRDRGSKRQRGSGVAGKAVPCASRAPGHGGAADSQRNLGLDGRWGPAKSGRCRTSRLTGMEPVPVQEPIPEQDIVELVTGSVTPAPKSATVSAGVGTGAPSVTPVVVKATGEPDEPIFPFALLDRM